MNRYSAKMLFQFRADQGNGLSNVMRLCEERIIVILARNASSALRKVKAYGKRKEFEGKAEAGNPIYFEFVGVADLFELGIETEPEEVWYEIITIKQPFERWDTLMPEESELNAIRRESQKIRDPTSQDTITVSNFLSWRRRKRKAWTSANFLKPLEPFSIVVSRMAVR